MRTSGHSEEPPRLATTPAKAARLRFHVLLALLAAPLIANAGTFLPFQSLWVDETTQVRGIELGVPRLLQWLTGHGPALDVPDDCAPPLSYLLQMGWGRLWGVSEPSLRWFGIACTYVGTLFAATAALRAYGRRAAAAVALLFAVSPNVMVFAVEIRSYPLFFMLACMSAHLTVRAVSAPDEARRRWIACLSGVLVAAVYTHFFGLVLAGACFLALAVDQWNQRRSLRSALSLGGALAIASIGLVPFVRATLKVTQPTDGALSAVPTSPMRSLALLGYRLFAHPVLAGWPAVAGLVLVGALVAVLAAVSVRRADERVRTACLVAVGSGLAVVIASSFVLVRLRPTTPSYNVWALPFLAILLSRGLSAPGVWSRRGAAMGLALILGGSIWGSVAIHREPDAYAHGPQRRVLALLSRLGPGRTMVIYDGESTAAGHVFFPIRFTFGRQVPQFIAEGPDAHLAPFDPLDGPGVSLPPLFAVVLRPKFVRSAELARAIERREPAETPIGAAEALRLRGWRTVSRERWISMVTTDVEVLEKVP